MDKKPKDLIILSSNHAIKVIKATANITPGIAYPEIDNVENIFNILLFETLFPQFEIKEKNIKITLDKKTK